MKNITDSVNSDLYQVSRESNRLKHLVSQCMPIELAQEILFLRVADGKLRITVGNSAWAARLRFHSREIIRRLGSTKTPVKEVSVHVLPANRKIKIGAREIEQIRPEASAQAVSRIRQVAQSVGGDDSDDGLGAALARLAGHLEKGE